MKVDTKRLLGLMKDFKNKKIAVIGDFCLDEYIWGDMKSISPEAPIPRIIIKSRRYVPGAAGNTACGVRALGAETYAIGVIGDDTSGKIMLEEFEKRGINIEGMVIAKRNTATYSRVLAGGFHCPKQQIVRYDIENEDKIDEDSIEKIIDFVKKIINKVDTIIFADYDEQNDVGIATPEVISEITRLANENQKILVGDSRLRINQFKNFTLVVPNDYEAAHAAEMKIKNEEDLVKVGQILLDKLKTKAVVITKGKEGMSVFEKNEKVNKITHIPTAALDVFDVTGAGDTVTAMMALALSSKSSFVEAASLANYAAGVTVSKEGTVSVTREETAEMIKRREAIKSSQKIQKLRNIIEVIKDLKKHGKKIVFLNGYFDPLHVGHIKILSDAKKLGDVLVVGVNNDDSVRKNKGPNRPFMSEEERVQILASLDCVDYINIFSELTPIKLISEIKPDVLIKGNNYRVEEVIGNDIVESYGGKVVLLPMIKGLSSDAILESMNFKNENIR